MALLRLAALIVLACAGCVDSALEPPAAGVDMGPTLISTCAEAAEFAVICGVFDPLEVAALTQQCETLGERWTTCALFVGKRDCKAIDSCLKPLDQGVPSPDSGTGCASDEDCGANQVCVEGRCKTISP